MSTLSLHFSKSMTFSLNMNLLRCMIRIFGSELISVYLLTFLSVRQLSHLKVSVFGKCSISKNFWIMSSNVIVADLLARRDGAP